MPLPAFIQPVVTWIGRTLLVRLAVQSAAAGAGAGAAIATSDEPESSDLFDGLGWGEVTGVEILNEVEAHWNDQGAGNGERCDESDEPDDWPPCQEGAEDVSLRKSDRIGIWAADDFEIRIEWEYDGCDITSLLINWNVPRRTYRAHTMKTAIMRARVQPTSEYSPPPCYCCKEPAAIKVIVTLQHMLWGFFSNGVSSQNITFVIGADGYGTVRSDGQWG